MHLWVSVFHLNVYCVMLYCNVGFVFEIDLLALRLYVAY